MHDFLGWWLLRLRKLMPRGPFGRREYILAQIAASGVLVAIALAPLTRADELRHLRAEAARPSPLRDELRRLAAPVVAASAERAKPDALDALRMLTELLPDDARLVDLSIAAREIRLAGTCRDARSLVARLSRSGYFARVAFAAPTGKATDGGDLFAIVLVPR